MRAPRGKNCPINVRGQESSERRREGPADSPNIDTNGRHGDRRREARIQAVPRNLARGRQDVHTTYKGHYLNCRETWAQGKEEGVVVSTRKGHHLRMDWNQNRWRRDKGSGLG